MKKPSPLYLLLVLSVLWALVLPMALHAADPYDELRIKREQVFEFVQKPEVTRNGDDVTITFESRNFCDCTVAIENAQGKIVRHLASGVLGDNAPLPFKKGSKKQTLVWDGKDDVGVYIDDKDSITVRVSLGLKPRFERTLFWSPKRRAQGEINWSVLPAVAPEGVYLYQGSGAEYVQLFDHDGNYVRTVYPFPRSKLKDVKGLKWVSFPPDGEKFPGKWGPPQNTLLTTRISSAGTDMKWPGGPSAIGRSFSQATGLAVDRNRIALAGYRLNRLSTDGGAPSGGQSGGLDLDGIVAGFKKSYQKYEGAFSKYLKQEELNAGPRSVAFSPDGKWMYTTGYVVGALFKHWLHGLARTRFDGSGEAKCWIGSMDRSGTDNKRFRIPTSVAVDAKGRVYVSDYLNDRIQVFSEEGKFLKTIPVKKPMRVSVHPKTGDIYVCSWLIAFARDKKTAKIAKGLRVPATVTHLGPFDAPKVKGTYALPLRAYRPDGGGYSPSQIFGGLNGMDYRVEIDFHAGPLRVWIVQFTADSRRQRLESIRTKPFAENVEIYELKDEKLKLIRSFSEDARKAVVRLRPPALARQRLYFDHKNERLYVGEAGGFLKAISELVCVNPATGAVRLVKLPFLTEDLGFDMQGMAYLRTSNRVVRYDAGAWREVPYDYGQDMNGVIYNFAGRANLLPGKGVKVMSGLHFPGQTNSSSQHGGIGVSPDGTVAVAVLWNMQAKDRRDAKALSSRGAASYSPRLFPGRRAVNQIRMFDRHGKCVTMDALPGVGYCQGVQVDKDRNIYVQSDYVRMYGGKRFPNSHSCTLIKAKPEKAAVLTVKAPIKMKRPPERSKDVHVGWVQGADWLYGGVGLSSLMRFDVKPTYNCHCDSNARFALDYYARSFVSESDRYRIAVLDTNGNLITHVGKYGNVDDGLPLVKAGGPPSPRSIGGDEVAIMHCLQLTTHTDKRLFLADWGNYRIVSVKLGYHADEKVALKDVPQ